LLAPPAAHVTMLQRSSTWIVSRLPVDRMAEALRRPLLSQLKPQLPPGFDIERHFHPR
jgi:cation diffusion facilitator CzcD-associated flavoprotein CzcO